MKQIILNVSAFMSEKSYESEYSSTYEYTLDKSSLFWEIAKHMGACSSSRDYSSLTVTYMKKLPPLSE